MAVAGSGGWKPSRKTKLANNQLTFIGYAQNKPRSVVHMDMHEAAKLLRAGNVIEIHFYADNIGKLKKILGNDTSNAPKKTPRKTPLAK
jgi:hypothetical protein